ncbi:DUF4249 domain-containing protein [Spirosoma oryzicola]|uniref:DUF4249 domain-containing protein n=1 Tax=Spirosoma oryzicola TaxID=2898794 RepID=UPI001E48951C|nr:DUF4249 domain-containing protein [Spirosoma oryzicola]UHG94487.1 DUF4249 domain-containing protein [Spirosoma oryzicola]
MRSFFSILLVGLVAFTVPVACVDPIETTLTGRLNIIVVDGTINNLAEPQVIRLNRSLADPVTGLPGSLPITKATVEVLVDSTQVISAHETTNGSYQLPSDFRGQTGHAYQLRFTLPDGTRYQSSQQSMPDGPPITRVRAQFNPTSFPAQFHDGKINPSRGAHEFYLDTQDPAGQHNYYRWDWTLYERQYWCRTCQQGVYSIYKVLPNTFLSSYYFVTGNELYEGCFTPPAGQVSFDAPIVSGIFTYDYNCRTECWEMIRNSAINLFDDVYSNGGQIVGRNVAQIPFYQRPPCLVDIRQVSLTRDAYRYYKLFEEQAQNNGGLAATPTTALAGNVHNMANSREMLVGYFTASSISAVHYWLDRNDAEGIPLGATDPSGPHENSGDDLFYALNSRRPVPEPSPPYTGTRGEPRASCGLTIIVRPRLFAYIAIPERPLNQQAGGIDRLCPLREKD